MTWSFQLRHGDLALSGPSFGIVTNEAKLVQDLRCALLEHMGTDSLHPGFGSLIDGGINAQGVTVPSIVGNEQLDLVILTVESEIQRIARDHQARQLSRAKNDNFTYNKSTLTPAEVLLTIVDITVTNNQDALNVNVALQTASGGQIHLDVPIPSEAS